VSSAAFIDGVLGSLLAARPPVVVAEPTSRAACRIAAITSCAVLATLFAATAIGCSTAALWIFLRPHIGPILAPLAASGILVVLSLVLALIARSLFAPARAAIAAPALSGRTAVSPLFRDDKHTALLTAMLAGLRVASEARRTKPR
jgi:hypothetical protein